MLSSFFINISIAIFLSANLLEEAEPILFSSPVESPPAKLGYFNTTRMTTFIEAKLKNLDKQTNIKRYTLAVHEMLENMISEKKKLKRRIHDMDIIKFLDLNMH